MSSVSPTLEGFRAAFRRPSLTFAEITWRWAVGAAAVSLLLFGLIEYLDTLPVSNRDATLLRTRQPVLVGRVLAHILRGSLSRAVVAFLLAAVALSFLWIVAASIGRAATVHALLYYFRSRADTSTEMQSATEVRPFRALAGLNFLRAAAALAALLALVGAAILASFVSSNANPQPALSFILFLPLAGLVCLAFSALNWFLSLACIFSVRDDESALDAVSAALTFFRERAGPVFAVSTWTGVAHLTAFSIASTAVSVPLAFIHVARGRLVLAGVAIVTLAYFAVADWLYIARLAGYICIAEIPQALSISVPTSELHPEGQQLPTQTIDRDESILSDVPNLANGSLAVETCL